MRRSETVRESSNENRQTTCWRSKFEEGGPHLHLRRGDNPLSRRRKTKVKGAASAQVVRHARRRVQLALPARCIRSLYEPSDCFTSEQDSHIQKEFLRKTQFPSKMIQQSPTLLREWRGSKHFIFCSPVLDLCFASSTQRVVSAT